MKIALISDSHLGITSHAALKIMLDQLKYKEFDVLVHAGDYSGEIIGWRAVRDTVALIRKYFPNKPFISVLGNHDFWCRPKDNIPPTPESFDTNYLNIKDIFKKNNVHFLDEDGIYIHPDWPDVKIVGNSGWYNNPNPPTNDAKYLPKGMDGDTNACLLKRAYNGLFDVLDQYNPDPSDTLVFVSHFPVIKRDNDRGDGFETFSWSATLGETLKSHYKVKYFLDGHSHIYSNGPIAYNCGPDYYKPTYLIINV